MAGTERENVTFCSCHMTLWSCMLLRCDEHTRPPAPYQLDSRLVVATCGGHPNQGGLGLIKNQRICAPCRSQPGLCRRHHRTRRAVGGVARPARDFRQPAPLRRAPAASAVTSAFKVSLPLAKSGSTMSVSYAVDFAALLLLGPNETMLVAVTSAWSQCTFRMKTTNPSTARSSAWRAWRSPCRPPAASILRSAACPATSPTTSPASRGRWSARPRRTSSSTPA